MRRWLQTVYAPLEGVGETEVKILQASLLYELQARAIEVTDLDHSTDFEPHMTIMRSKVCTTHSAW